MADPGSSRTSHRFLSGLDNGQTSFNEYDIDLETALRNSLADAAATASAPEEGYYHHGQLNDGNSQIARSLYNSRINSDPVEGSDLILGNPQRQPHPQQPQQFGFSNYPSTSTSLQPGYPNTAPKTDSKYSIPQQVNSASASFGGQSTQNSSSLGLASRSSSDLVASFSSEITLPPSPNILPPEVHNGPASLGFDQALPSAEAMNPLRLHPSAWPQRPGGRRSRDSPKVRRASSSSRPRNRSFTTSTDRSTPTEQAQHVLHAHPLVTENSSPAREYDRSTTTKRRRRNRTPSRLTDISLMQSSHNQDQLLTGTRISSTLRYYLGDESIESLKTALNPGFLLSSIVGSQRFNRRSLFHPSRACDIIFLSHLIPRKFDIPTRLQFLFIFNFRAPYVPLAVLQHPDGQIFELGNDLFEKQKQTEMQERLHLPLGPNGGGWPTMHHGPSEHPRALPVEIFEEIGSYLPRDQIQKMRFVNQEFEKKISCLAFRTVVVPFKPKIYGGPAQEYKDNPGLKNPEQAKDVDRKGKGKVIADTFTKASSETVEYKKVYNPKKDLQDGMRVFEEWGPQIKRFALTFEVAEETLINLPRKANRYETAENLEQKADESIAMTHALSRLTYVTELGLSILSGLGWQNGPDQSDRARLLKTKPKVFGTQFPCPDPLARYQTEQWNEIVREQAVKPHRQMLAAGNRGYFESVRVTPVGESSPRMIFRSSEHKSVYPPIMFQGINMEADGLAANEPRDAPDDLALQAIQDRLQARDRQQIEQTSQGSPIPYLATVAALNAELLEPNRLQPEQKEWLLEMEWAHGAFFSSFCLALLDNRDTFFGLNSLNIANISSKYLEKLKRDDIWTSLPNIENLIVLVSPDWRTVYKNANGIVSAPQIKASSSQDLFWEFLSALFRHNKKITMLTIGYTDGGEHATGMMARNKNIIPAPIFKIDDQHNQPAVQGILEFKHLRVLTVTNCWLTPPAMKMFIKAHQLSCLEEITFDSVSLTAQPPRIVTAASAPNTVSNAQADGFPAMRRPSRPVVFKDWLTDDPRPGSWPDVLDRVTPGYGIAFQRHLRDDTEFDPSPAPKPTNIRSISFNSCGYVRLTNMASFDQSSLPHVTSTLPTCLHYRFQDLECVMLDGKQDTLLGQIVPVMEDEEMECLETVFGMTFGWGEDPKQYENREDGQPNGGSGRFSGTLMKSDGDE
ncbi:MAG: hypothetical protein Q9167_003843 [Letrouitia subvulpina]